MKCPRCGSTDIVQKTKPDERIGPIVIRSSCSICTPKATANQFSSEPPPSVAVTHVCQKCSAYLCSKCAGATGCFIATACYGDYDAPEVRILRHFRDETLLKSAGGCRVVDMYYRISPPLARWLERHPTMAGLFRASVLNPIATVIGTTKK